MRRPLRPDLLLFERLSSLFTPFNSFSWPAWTPVSTRFPQTMEVEGFASLSVFPLLSLPLLPLNFQADLLAIPLFLPFSSYHSLGFQARVPRSWKAELRAAASTPPSPPLPTHLLVRPPRARPPSSLASGDDLLPFYPESRHYLMSSFPLHASAFLLSSTPSRFPFRSLHEKIPTPQSEPAGHISHHNNADWVMLDQLATSTEPDGVALCHRHAHSHTKIWRYHMAR